MTSIFRLRMMGYVDYIDGQVFILFYELSFKTIMKWLYTVRCDQIYHTALLSVIQSPHNTQKLIHYMLTMILLFFKNQHLLSFFFYRHLRWQLRSWFLAFLLSCEKIWKKRYRILLALNIIPWFWQFQTRLILKLDWQRH